MLTLPLCAWSYRKMTVWPCYLKQNCVFLRVQVWNCEEEKEVDWSNVWMTPIDNTGRCYRSVLCMGACVRMLAHTPSQSPRWLDSTINGLRLSRYRSFLSTILCSTSSSVQQDISNILNRSLWNRESMERKFPLLTPSLWIIKQSYKFLILNFFLMRWILLFIIHDHSNAIHTGFPACVKSIFKLWLGFYPCRNSNRIKILFQ